MGALDEDVERCLCEACCDEQVAAQAACACGAGRLREAKRALLAQRRVLLDDVHEKQRSIDAIDHMLHRMSTEGAGHAEHACAGTRDDGSAAPSPRTASAEGEVPSHV